MIAKLRNALNTVFTFNAGRSLKLTFSKRYALKLDLNQSQSHNHNHNHKQAFSLIEMVVVLAITSILMLAIIGIVTTVLRISAIVYNRAQIRENLITVSNQFEKDIRNADSLGACGGEYDGDPTTTPRFSCTFGFSGATYVWETCPREIPPECTEPGNNYCTDESETFAETLCKRRVGSPEIITEFDNYYNLKYVGVSDLYDEDPDPEARRLIAFTMVAAHPADNLNIDNMVRQSVVTTKNFETVITVP